MQIHAPEGLKRIRSLVSSLDGVVGCGIETQNGGAIRTLEVASTPETDAGKLAQRIRIALRESLDVHLGPEQLSIRTSAPSADGIEDRPAAGHSAGGEHGAGPGNRGDDTRPSRKKPAASPVGRGGAGYSPAQPKRDPSEQAAGPGPRARSAPGAPAGGREPGPDAPAAGSGPLGFGGYALFGEPDGRVELRVRVTMSGERFEGASRETSLDRVTAETFVAATLRAVELALDTRPVDDRSSRILILEQDEVEEVELDDGPFVAVKVRALYREGQKSATGFEPLDGSGYETAARAVLDAVQRILEGRDTKPRSGERSGSDRDPFFTWS